MNIKQFYPVHWFHQGENTYPAQRNLNPREAMQAEIDRIFDYFFTPFWGSPVGFMEQTGQGTWHPDLELHETEKEYTVAVELPGVDEKDVTIEVQADNTLVIRGEKKSEVKEEDTKGGTYRSERLYGTFYRALELPYDTKVDDIGASFDKGVLTVIIPKGECKDTREIPITGKAS